MCDMKVQIDDHLRTIQTLYEQIPLIEAIAETVIETIRAGGKLCVLGNGGSAADAQHIAAELMGRFKRDRQALPAIALTTDTSALTAIANDLGAGELFTRQVQGLVTDRDVVWALSVSGRSPNVLDALRAAKENRAKVIGFTSKTGHAMAELCDQCLMVDAVASDRVQEAHELAYHLVCDRVERAFVNTA